MKGTMTPEDSGDIRQATVLGGVKASGFRSVLGVSFSSKRGADEEDEGSEMKMVVKDGVCVCVWILSVSLQFLGKQIVAGYGEGRGGGGGR